MPCPHCCDPTRVVKKGRFSRGKDGNSSSQRYFCFSGRRGFSQATGTITYRQRGSELDRVVFYHLTSGAGCHV